MVDITELDNEGLFSFVLLNEKKNKFRLERPINVLNRRVCALYRLGSEVASQTGCTHEQK